MRFADVKVGDVIFRKTVEGLRQWGRLYYPRTFWVSHPVTKVTATQFVAGDDRYNKNGNGVGHDGIAYKANSQCGDDLVPSESQIDGLNDYRKSLRILTQVRGIQLDIHSAPDINTALRAAVLIREAHTLLSGGSL